MTAVEMLHRDNDYRLLRAQEDPQANAYWCFMHAARFPQATGYRACFTPQLIKGRGGVFEITAGNDLLFSKKQLGRFPEPGEIENALASRAGFQPSPA